MAGMATDRPGNDVPSTSLLKDVEKTDDDLDRR